LFCHCGCNQTVGYVRLDVNKCFCNRCL